MESNNRHNANLSSDSAESTHSSDVSHVRQLHVQRHIEGRWSVDSEDWLGRRNANTHQQSSQPSLCHQASQLRQYLTKLQSTIDSIISTSDSASGSESPEELSSQLHDEYERMSGTLNRLESMLLGQRNTSSNQSLRSTNSFSYSHPNDEIGLLDCVVTDRDEVIRRLSDRIRSLCQANDQLYSDFESQEHLLTNEMRILRQQLEDANHAIQTLSCQSCGPEAQDAVIGGVAAMREAQEAIDELRAKLVHKEKELQLAQRHASQSISGNSLDLNELKRLCEYCFGDLEFSNTLRLMQINSSEDFRSVLERIRSEFLVLMNSVCETKSTCEDLANSKSRDAAGFSHFLHCFHEQARSLLQRVRLHSPDAHGESLTATWESLTKMDLSADVNEAYDGTLQFVKEIFDFLYQELQNFDRENKELINQTEGLRRESMSLLGRANQLEAWNKDNEDRIQQMERDRDEEMEIARQDRTSTLSKCQSLAEQLNRVKMELESERQEKSKVSRESVGSRDQLDRSQRRASEFESRLLHSQEELAHLNMKVADYESSLEHLQLELVSLQTHEGELAAKLECTEKDLKDMSDAYKVMCGQLMNAQAEKTNLEGRMQQLTVMEEQLRARESVEVVLREEVNAMLRENEVTRRNNTLTLQQMSADWQEKEVKLTETINEQQRKIKKMKAQLTEARRVLSDNNISPDVSFSVTSPIMSPELVASPPPPDNKNVKFFNVDEASSISSRPVSPMMLEISESKDMTLTGAQATTCIPESRVSSCPAPKPATSKSEVFVDMSEPYPYSPVNLSPLRDYLSTLVSIYQTSHGDSQEFQRRGEELVLKLAADADIIAELRGPLASLCECALSQMRTHADLKRQAAGSQAAVALHEVESAHLQVERQEMDAVIEDYETRFHTMRTDLQEHTHDQMSMMMVFQQGFEAREILLSKLNDVIVDFTAAISDPGVPLNELRGLFGTSFDLPERINLELEQLRSHEMQCLRALHAGEHLLKKHALEVRVSMSNVPPSHYPSANVPGPKLQASSVQGSAPVIELSQLRRLEKLRGKITDPRFNVAAEGSQIITECLELFDALRATCQFEADGFPQSNFQASSTETNRRTSERESRHRIMVETDSIDLPDGGQNTSLPNTPITNADMLSVKSKKSSLMNELLQVEKECRGQTLAKKKVALQDLLKRQEEALEETEDEEEADDLKAIISLTTGLIQVIEAEVARKTTSQKVMYSQLNLSKAVQVCVGDHNDVLKALLLKISSEFGKSPDRKKERLMDLLQLHVDKMRGLPSQDMAIMTSLAEIMNALIKANELELQTEKLKEKIKELKAKVVSDEIVLSTLTHYNNPQIKGELLGSESSVSQVDAEVPQMAPFPTPASLPKIVYQAFEAVRAVATQPHETRLKTLNMLRQANLDSLKRAPDEEHRKSCEIVGSFMDIVALLESTKSAYKPLKASRLIADIVDDIAGIDPKKSGATLEALIQSYNDQLPNAQGKEQKSLELSLQLLNAFAKVLKESEEIIKEARSTKGEELSLKEVSLLKAVPLMKQSFTADEAPPMEEFLFVESLECSPTTSLAKRGSGANRPTPRGAAKSQSKADSVSAMSPAGKPGAAKKRPSAVSSVSESEIKPQPRTSLGRSEDGSERQSLVERRRGSLQQNVMDTILGRLSPILCDEALSYIETRLPSGEKELLKIIKDIRSKKASIVTKAIATSRSHKMVDPMLAIRLAEAVSEEMKIRKDPAASQPRNLETVIRRFQELQRTANPRHQPSFAEAVRLLQGRADLLRCEDELKKTRLRLQATENELSELRDEMAAMSRSLPVESETPEQSLPSAHRKSSQASYQSGPRQSSQPSYQSGPRQSSQPSYQSGPRKSSDAAMDRVLSQVPMEVRDDLMAVLQERILTANQSLTDEVKHLRVASTQKSSEIDDLSVQMPVVIRVIDALKEEKCLENKPHEYRMAELERLIKEHEKQLAECSENDKPGVLAALRILKTQSELMKLDDEYVMLRAELTGSRARVASLMEQKDALVRRCSEMLQHVSHEGVEKETKNFLKSVKESMAASDTEMNECVLFARLGHLLSSVPTDVRSDVLDVLEEKVACYAPKLKKEVLRMRQNFTGDARRLHQAESQDRFMEHEPSDSHDAKLWQSNIPSPSKRSSGHIRRSWLGFTRFEECKRLSEMLEQQCQLWEDTEEQCSQEMNLMCRRLTGIYNFISQDKWQTYSSVILEKAANGILNVILMLKRQVQPNRSYEEDLRDETQLFLGEMASGGGKEVIMLLVKDKFAYKSQIDGLVNVNRDMKEQLELSRAAIKGSSGVLVATSHKIDAITGQLEVEGRKNEHFNDNVLQVSKTCAALIADLEESMEDLQKIALSAIDSPMDDYEDLVRTKFLVLSQQLLLIDGLVSKLMKENNSLKGKLCQAPMLLEPEGDQPLQFQFETRLGASGNVEGRVMMQKDGCSEPVQLDFNMLLTGAEGVVLQSHTVDDGHALESQMTSEAIVESTTGFGAPGLLETATTSNFTRLDTDNNANLAPEARYSSGLMKASPSRLTRALQRFTKRRKRSQEPCMDTNQNNSDLPGLDEAVCSTCRVTITATTASSTPWLCAACAGPFGGSDAHGGEGEWSTVSTLTADTTLTSLEAASSPDFARADSPSLVEERARVFEPLSPPLRDGATQADLRSSLQSPPILPRRRRTPLKTPEFRRHLVSDLVDQVSRLSFEDGALRWELASPGREAKSEPVREGLSIPYHPQPSPRFRRQEAESRLQAATASLRKSLAQSFRGGAASQSQVGSQQAKFVNLRKPVFFRDLRSNQ